MNLASAIAFARLITQPQYPLIGTFVYNQPITNWQLQVSNDFKNWYDIDCTPIRYRYLSDSSILIFPSQDAQLFFRVKDVTPASTP